MKDEQSSVKRQIGGSNELRIWWIYYPQKADEKRNPMKMKIKWFRIIIKEISYFKNQRLFRPKIGENEEHYELIYKIKDLNLIKIQITSW